MEGDLGALICLSLRGEGEMQGKLGGLILAQRWYINASAISSIVTDSLLTIGVTTII
jgi:hypothetical protein